LRNTLAVWHKLVWQLLVYLRQTAVVALAAGAFDVKKGTFIIWVAIAKTVRFWLLAVIITGVLSLLG
jgi:membrane protein YqaA with SNARE-associated domain